MRYRWVTGLVATLGAMLSLTVVAPPALAVNPMADLSIVAPPAFQKGDTHNVVVKLDSMSTGLNDSIAVSLTISNATEVATLDFAVTQVTIGSAYCPNPSNDGFTCTFPYDGSPNLVITYTLKNNTDTAPVGGSKTFDKSLVSVNDLTNVTVTTSLSQYFNLKMLGPVPATTISGETDDTTGNPIPGALVNLHDSASPAHSYSTHTDSQGKFSFPADATHPVAAGQVSASATKSGYKTRSGTPKNFTPGTPISGWKLLVTPIAAARPTTPPTPSQSAATTPGALPSGVQASPISGVSEPVFGSDAALTSSNGGGSDLLKYVLIGGLILVLAAIAIMVTMLIRRRRADDRGEDGGGYPQQGYDAGYPPSQYSYDDAGRS